MDSTGNGGSVAFLQNIKHPVSVARKVMDDTKHVMLVGEGARQFAVSNGFKETNLLTRKSEKEWKEWLKTRREMTPHETHDTISVLVQDAKGDLSGACADLGIFLAEGQRNADGTRAFATAKRSPVAGCRWFGNERATGKLRAR